MTNARLKWTIRREAEAAEMAKDAIKVNHEHCWHDLGSVDVTAIGDEFPRGADRLKCCHCGEHLTRYWRLKPLPGHGRFAPHDATERVYDGVDQHDD